MALGALALAGSAAAGLPLAFVRDIQAGPATGRFDYASLDPVRRRLFVADLAGGRVLVFDLARDRLAAAIPGVPGVHGVLAVPDLDRVFASATAAHETVAIDEETLSITARAPSGRYPDGIAWDPHERELFVSDERGSVVTVLSAEGRRVATISMGGEVGNTQYDPTSGRVLSNVQTLGELVEIVPSSRRIVSRWRIAGCAGPHGLLIDGRIAFIACEDNARLIAWSLAAGRELADDGVGGGPDVLAFDPGLGRLYVASESGVVSVFAMKGGALTRLGQARLAENAHSVAVDPTTHLVYFPLRNVAGKAVVRVMAPTAEAPR